MDIRQGMHSEHFKTLDTTRLREEFLIESVFRPGELTMTYSHIDRIVVGGICPTSAAITFAAELGKTFGVEYFLQRREIGMINLGGAGYALIDGERFDVGHRDALYIGMGKRDVQFCSVDAAKPARFYYNSAPAHHSYLTRTIRRDEAVQVTLGDAATSNRRTINKYLVPDVLETCQLSMGMTELAEGSLWNTMPCHTHERRMEVYFYFNMKDDGVVFHMMGQPQETRHLVVRNEQAVISPSWSIHSGVGSASYTFIWGMVGENQTFDDMDHVAMQALR